MDFRTHPKGQKERAQDNYNTPLNAWQDILKYFDKNTTIWCPFYNDGSCANLIESLGYKCFHENQDYFTTEQPENTILIDNPPYSCKKRIILRAYESGKPFALLLPLDTLDRKYLHELFTKGLQVIIPKRRYVFTQQKRNYAPFKAIWFCWNMSQYLGTTDTLIFVPSSFAS